MAGARKGRAILLKVNTAAANDLEDPEYTTIGGLRSRTITLNQETVDVTNDDSTGLWRELLADGGVKSFSFSGNGVFKTEAPMDVLRRQLMSETFVRNWQVVVPGFGTFEGPMQVTQLEYAGEYNGEATFSISAESAGEIEWTAAP